MSTYNDASLIYYPSGYKASKAYSLKPTDGSGDLTFTRASSATRVNEQGLIETAGVISPTELVTNGDFATDTDWNKGTGWTISGGLAIGTSVANSVALYQTPLTIGKKYKITFDLVSVSSGGVRERIGGTPNATIRTSVGTYSYTQVADSSIAGIIASSSGFTGTIDNVSVKEVIENNVPRIDFSGGGCGKLLLEPQRTNSILYSSAFDNAYHPKVGVTVETNSTISPEGIINACKIKEDLSTGAHLINDVAKIATTLNTFYTFSIFLKKEEISFFRLQTNGTAFNGKWINVDLNSGTISHYNNISPSDCSITAYPNEWYRVTLTAQAGVAQNAGVQLFLLNSNNTSASPQHVGNGVNSMYLYGLSVEAGSYVTSYIPTNTTAVTRVSDIAGKSGISSLIGQTEGVVFYDFIWQTTGQANQSSSVNSGSYYNSISFGHYGGALRLEIYYNGTPISLGSQVLIDGQRYKIAFAYKSGDSATYVNGVQLSTSSTSFAFAAALNSLFLSYDGENFGDKVNTYMLFTTRLSNTELETLTTL